MRWTKFLITNKIKYNLYKINTKDSIIIKKINHNQVMIILFGISYIAETFINNEICPLAVLKTNNIFTINKSSRPIYYKIIPLTKTYILNIEINKDIDKKLYMLIYKEKLKSYIIEHDTTINTIIRQKNTTNRILQLILILCLKCGQIKGKDIHIPFELSNKNIAILTGTSENTVTKIINKIYKSKIIKKMDHKIVVLDNINNLKSQ